jgi:hypothetical protein
MGGGRGEGQEEEKIGHGATQAARLNLQCIEKCGLRRQVREEMVSSASRSRHDGNAWVVASISVALLCSVAGRTGAKRSETETDRKIVFHALVFIV